MKRAALSLVLLAAAVAALHAAGPKSVYGPTAPGDSAFVRILNLLPDPVKVTLGGTRIGPVAPNTVSAYMATRPDIFVVRAGGQEAEVVGKSGTWTTVACTPKGIVVFVDTPHTDAARAQLFLYNLTTIASLDLKTADGKTLVIGGVAAGKSGLAVVNAVAVTLGAWNGTALVKALAPLTLARGSSYSIFAVGGGSTVTLIAAKAEVKTE